MRIAEFLREELVLSDVRATQKLDILRELAEALAAREPAVSAKELVPVLVEREKLGSTALDQGIAIPHGKLNSVRRLVGCLGRSRKGVDFGAEDGSRTHLFFLLVAPTQSAGDHLKALARISRLFRPEPFRERLMAADSAVEMYRLIDEADTASAR